MDKDNRYFRIEYNIIIIDRPLVYVIVELEENLTISFFWLKKNQIPIFPLKSTNYIKNIPFSHNQIPIIPV